MQRSNFFWLFLVVVSFLLACVVMRWPTFEVRSWIPPKIPAPVGVWKVNQLMVSSEMIGSDKMVAPEDIAVDTKGRVYSGCVDGTIWRVDRSGKSEVFANTQGRPLGLVFANDGTLYVADAMKGLLSVDTTGKVKVLVDSYKGRAFSFADDLDIDVNGNIYFTDASQLVGGSRQMDVRPDILSHVPTGRLYKYETKTKKLSLLHDKLYFANGVVLSHDESYLLVVETAVYKVTRLWLKGPKKGTFEPFASNLRGYPDNINRSSDGGFWVGLTSPRLADVETTMHPRAWLKKFILVLPEFLLPKPVRMGHVIKLNAAGKVVESLQDPKGKTIANTASAYESKGYLYFGHIYYHATQIGRYKLPTKAKK